MTDKIPTIKEIENEFDELKAEYMIGGFISETEERFCEAVKYLIEKKITEMLEGLKMKEREVRYEELDTGIGIDRLEYSGQDGEHGYNQAVRELNQNINKLLGRK